MLLQINSLTIIFTRTKYIDSYTTTNQYKIMNILHMLKGMITNFVVLKGNVCYAHFL